MNKVQTFLYGEITHARNSTRLCVIFDKDLDVPVLVWDGVANAFVINDAQEFRFEVCFYQELPNLRKILQLDPTLEKVHVIKTEGLWATPIYGVWIG